MTLSRLNAVCPYFTMYPLEFPLRVLPDGNSNSEWVFDPFCGRGTTSFAARVKGMPSIGLDSNPVAVAIAQAKLVKTSTLAVVACAEKILKSARQPESIPDGSFWKWAFGKRTLVDICRIREDLLRNSKSPSRKMLRAIMLGALHGPRCKGLPSYFSNQCLRTFAPKPGYSLRFWRKHKLKPVEVDVVGVIKRRAERFLSAPLPEVEGAILLRDSRKWKSSNFKGLFKWVVTSPPYYGMDVYIPDQWLRNWFAGGPCTINYGRRSIDLQHSSADAFACQLRKVWRNAAFMSTSDARLVCRFGGIYDRNADCLDILKSSFRDSGWKVTTIRNAGSALDGRRQAVQFGMSQKKRPREEYDVYAIHSS